MEIEFDPDKDAANIAKHGISLARAVDLEGAVVVRDDRFAGEQRYRLYGRIGGEPFCLAAVLRGGIVRAISLRRSHSKEFNRHVS
jgi:uncharacterized DUF497 family protein